MATIDYIQDADQWSDSGWRWENGEFFSFTTDRKEQNEQTGRRMSADEFFTNEDIPIEVRRWFRDKLGLDFPVYDDKEFPCR